jgi:hypothetical protein
VFLCIFVIAGRIYCIVIFVVIDGVYLDKQTKFIYKHAHKGLKSSYLRTGGELVLRPGKQKFVIVSLYFSSSRSLKIDVNTISALPFNFSSLNGSILR